MSRFEEILSRDGRLIYKTMGVSMLPMLHENRDLVVIEPPKERLRKYDVALYKRGTSYVLHRVIKVLESGYLIRGDNTYMDEHVPEEAVIGVLTGFTRKGKTVSTEDSRYQRYVRFWCRIYPVRRVMIAVRRLLGRIARKLGLRKPKST